MKLTAEQSIFYPPFLKNHPLILNEAVHAVKSHNLEVLGDLMERSTLQMHATLLGLNEPIWYMNKTTIEAMSLTKELRAKGYECYFTMDAGPHVKVLCKNKDVSKLVEEFSSLDEVSRITPCRSGPGAYLHA